VIAARRYDIAPRVQTFSCMGCNGLDRWSLTARRRRRLQTRLLHQGIRGKSHRSWLHSPSARLTRACRLTKRRRRPWRRGFRGTPWPLAVPRGMLSAATPDAHCVIGAHGGDVAWQATVVGAPMERHRDPAGVAIRRPSRREGAPRLTSMLHRMKGIPGPPQLADLPRILAVLATRAARPNTTAPLRRSTRHMSRTARPSARIPPPRPQRTARRHDDQRAQGRWRSTR
jgi:hypothetical protein